MKHAIFTLLLVMVGRLGIAQCPTPEIIGDFYGCGEDILVVGVDTFNAAHTYEWSVTPNAQVVAIVGQWAYIELPDTNKGTFNLILQETDVAGCTGTAMQVLTIEQNHALVCDDNLHVSMNESCTLDLVADIILEGQLYPNDSYTLEVTDSKGNPVSSPLNASYIHQKLKVSVLHNCSGNSCWGTILIEDKLAPVIDCPDDLTVSCFFNGTFAVPQASDNCDNFVPVQTISNELFKGECYDDYSAYRVIRYVATDDWGNVSDVCERTIYYLYEDIDSVKFPQNLDDITQDALTCDNDPRWDFNGNNYPDIAETGYPTLNGQKILQNNGLCKINSTYSDQRIDICESSYKIIRKWTILDWCSGKIVEGHQIIKVLDKYGPIVTCEPDFQLPAYTRPYECLADYVVPHPEVIFDCSSTTYTVGYILADANGNPPLNGEYTDDNIRVVLDNNGKFSHYVIEDLPKGRAWLRYTVTDACGHVTECFTEVDIIDDIPPVAVCDQNTVVSLTNVGFAQVFATTFDDGSTDNCWIKSFEVARMTFGCGENTSFKPSAIFCCADVGKELMVQLRVTDESGNSNTCMVNVQVQDKADPIITCPPHLTINCEESLDTAFTGSAIAVDNCPGVIVEMTQAGVLNKCKLGTITRTWKATDKSNRTATCVQRITVRDFTPFQASDIFWSSSVPNVTLEGCMDVDTHPDKTGTPTWRNDECSFVAASYEDQVFTIVDSACIKIIRNWTVIDWCTFDENNPSAGGIFTYPQVIKINNSTPPVIDQCGNITRCIDGPDCSDFIELIHSATDDCTRPQDLKYIYTIDLDNDGSIDRSGVGPDASGVFTPGTHKIKVEVQDGCGNFDDCTYLLLVKDCKAPTPYCFSELITVIMPSTEEIDIWAVDFDNGSFDNCPGDLRFSFSSNVNDTRRIFNCDFLGINRLQMYVTDAAGNQDFCEVEVDIQANGGICGGTRRISGTIKNMQETPMKGVEVILTEGAGGEKTITNTTADGMYNFYNPEDQTDYTVAPNKDDDAMNGVSTLDLVLIQRHILGITKLDSPHKIIAADVNNSKSITASDLVALRKLILGVDAKFAANTSWRFVDKNHVFVEPNYPWPYLEAIAVNGSSSQLENLDFYGVKIGDVNESAKVNFQGQNPAPRSEKPMRWKIQDQTYQAGDVVKVDVMVDAAYTLFGYQNTMAFAADNLSFVGIEAGLCDLDDSNLGMQKLNEGRLTTSWSKAENVFADEGQVLFSILFKAEKAGRLSTDFGFDSSVTQTEVYDENLEAQNLELRFEKIHSSTGLIVHQNNPNPFSDFTAIDFEIGSATDVILTVYDISGREVYRDGGYFEKGKHRFNLSADKLNSGGVLTYKVDSPLGTIVNKMVIVK